jgi:hypothetical protein
VKDAMRNRKYDCTDRTHILISNNVEYRCVTVLIILIIDNTVGFANSEVL